MTKPFSDVIGQATHLTKAGRLQEATELLQAALKGGSISLASETEEVIEGEFTRLDPAATRSGPKARVRTRTPLAETLRRIAAGGMPKPGNLFSVGEQPLPAGAEFRSLSHTSQHGSRTYRLYVPGNRNASMPLIVMLHGCTQTPEDFAAGTGMNALGEEFGCVIAYPQQPTGANSQKCWNWFRPEDQRRDQGEPALIAGLVRDILRDFPVDIERVYIVGLSAGGAAALMIASCYPDIFSAVGVHSGLPVGAAHDVPSAFAAMRNGSRGKRLERPLPTIVFHGSGDVTVNPKNGRAVIEQVMKHFPGLTKTSEIIAAAGTRTAYRTRFHDGTNRSIIELWEIEGAGHAWSGGSARGTFTDPVGPDASRAILEFFLQHSRS